jgi:small subunit ribosomal protein S9
MMAEDEKRPDEEQGEPEQPTAEQPEQPSEEKPAEDAPAEGTPDEETPAEEAPAEVPPADEPPAEEATAEDASTEAPTEQAPAEPKRAEEKKPKGEEAVPGAELDPIAIEPERELDAEERARREAEAEERARRERELIGDEEVERPLAHKPTKLSGDARFLATGKRKSSVARIILTPGSGTIEVNRRKLEEYFPRVYLQSIAKQPLVQSGYEGNVDVRVRVHGGGISGQAAAVRHGIARALCDVDPELRRELKRRGMLTRDARAKERRKAGLKKARKRPQFSKR